jgi:hypothetical protein
MYTAAQKSVAQQDELAVANLQIPDNFTAPRHCIASVGPERCVIKDCGRMSGDASQWRAHHQSFRIATLSLKVRHIHAMLLS